ncbi:uncharacterized protein PFL1_06316 [Pseudozyma flocculosa PF-1]|uniref:Glycosyl hydrolase family 13 catalytic domain-containing protein n=2 Tax=Pseudozyma flocculosa TaxID=84751 RepID=A0A061H1D9_9BASI|nr:uncharacterized protein PFL1_06316 [Pseudozyma flocculosa PF-1]EPQ26108.1 hypothetical protein PFL1_06316 [Pseudozyma flocculosa PF-1]SPO40353.1 probable alpha-amylase [Pseudozyma flocculosa]
MASSANKHSDAHEFNYTMMQAFEWYTPDGGVHWDWLASNAKRFADMGITAVWLPPPTKSSSPESTGYDIYDLYDLGEFAHPRDEKAGLTPAHRTKYGTREQLEAAMKALRDNGIAIYIDAVLNHKAGADELQTFKVRRVNSDNRNEIIDDEPFDIDGWTRFTFPGRGDKHSSFQWGFEHFTGVDWDQKGEQKAIFRIEGDNKHWASDTDRENGNFDYLMFSDIDHAHGDVKDDMLKWGRWMLRNFPVAGFRFDAVKHISREFIHDFVAAVRDEARQLRKERGLEAVDETEGPIAFSVGEFWKDSVDSCIEYLDKFGDEQFSLFDAPLHYNFAEAGAAGSSYDLRKVFDGTIVQRRPIDAVTLVENHDTQAGQSLQSPVPAAFKPLAYSLILLRQDGYPCVFLGDLEGCNAKGKEGDEGYAQPMADLEKFLKARKHFAYGVQRDYMDHANCIGWTREGVEAMEPSDEERGAGKKGTERKEGCAVVMCNGDGEGTKWMEVGKGHAGRKFVDVIGWYQGQVEINQDGWAEFKCHPRSVAVWVPEDSDKRQFF